MAETFKFIGKLTEKGNEQQVSATFVKREFVVEKQEQNGAGKVFVDHVKFQLVQGKVTEIENIPLGTEIEVSFNVRGKRYEKDGKVNYFNSLDAWKVSEVKSNNAFGKADEPVRTGVENTEGDQSLPF